MPTMPTMATARTTTTTSIITANRTPRCLSLRLRIAQTAAPASRRTSPATTAASRPPNSRRSRRRPVRRRCGHKEDVHRHRAMVRRLALRWQPALAARVQRRVR
jgi:hypothetical protein